MFDNALSFLQAHRTARLVQLSYPTQEETQFLLELSLLSYPNAERTCTLDVLLHCHNPTNFFNFPPLYMHLNLFSLSKLQPNLKIKRKPQKNVWGSCWASWLICTAQWQLDYTALLKSSQMSKKLKQRIFLNMMTLRRDDPGSGGWTSHQVRNRESCLAIPVMFATEESVPKQRLAQFTASYGNLENKTKTVCEGRSCWKNYYLQSYFTCPALLSVWLLGHW